MSRALACARAAEQAHQPKSAARRPVELSTRAARVRRDSGGLRPTSRCASILVAKGMNCCQVAEILGDAPRTVAYWLERFQKHGLVGLQDGAR
ncbi:MAG: helix-turn-helix domain-containing protein, partial [Acidimicrobiia bacterium]|nr:helix-turn-helix domain-containing protein [Acidimicrobiia bacterium]